MFKQSTITRRWTLVPVDWRRILFGMLMCVILAAPMSAQEQPTAIALNTPTKVALVAGGVRLVYSADGAQTVTIVARSLEAAGKIDPTLTVLDASNHQLPNGFNDDHHAARLNLSERDAMIENLALPAAGAYTIWLNSFNGVDTGAVEVTVEASNPFAETVKQDGDTLVIQAVLPAGQIYRHTFDGALGEVLVITVRDTSGTLDPLVTLGDSAGAVLAQNDDHADTANTDLDTLDAKIDGVVLPAAGTYTVEVSDFLGAAGTFELRITRRGAGG